MPVAIVHYHLRRGGVTRVIEAQSLASRERGIDHVILSGAPYHGSVDLPLAVLPDLDYLAGGWPEGGEQLAATLREAAGQVLGGPPAIWHFHNPVLGKNSMWPAMLRHFIHAGERMVWQYHDFVEDGRPGNYQTLDSDSEIYPVAPQIRHAFINSRDRQLLVEAGIPAAHTTFLPNAVIPPATVSTANPEPGTGDSPVVLYPVRGIRRKNLGELCLLAALAPLGTRFALTLKPENPDWRPFFDRWERFATLHNLPVEFGVVGHVPPAPGVEPTYDQWLAHATHLVTTSIAEGFGLSFLEPIALQKPLFGRDLPEITVDFKDTGIEIGDLYDALLIPREWIDLDALRHQFEHGLRNNYRSYHRELPPEAIATGFDALSRDGYLDFGNLPEPLQEAAATRALADPGALRVTRGAEQIAAREWLRGALARTHAASNAASLAPYSLSSCGAQLTDLYDRLRAVQTAEVKWLDEGKVLDQFLLPSRFHFLRT